MYIYAEEEAGERRRYPGGRQGDPRILARRPPYTGCTSLSRLRAGYGTRAI